MNIPLLQAIKKAILKHPRQFNMFQFFNRQRCIAGWAVHLHVGGKRIDATAAVCGDIHAEAQDLLGITFTESDRLFYCEEWPDRLANAYNNAKSATEAAKIAAKRIGRFIRTKGAE